jgi:hypothetical protein
MQVNTIFTTTQLVSSLIGNDIITKAIGDTSSTIYLLLYGILDYQDLYLEKFMEDLDIKYQIKCVEGIINNLDKIIIDKTLETSLENLHEIICKIREDLKQIDHNMKNHKLKWFYSYRRIDNIIQFENIKIHKKILNERLELFMKIVKINQFKIDFHNRNRNRNINI